MNSNLATQQDVRGICLQNLHEYLLVIHPSANIDRQIKEEKESFSAQYNVSIARKTLPHITVANFLAREDMEDTIIRYLHRICSMQKSFNVALNNYSGFPPHTVYARVQDHQPFKQLAASLKVIDQYVRSNGLPAAHFITHPHLTVARRLEKNVYEKAMFAYSQKTFHADFEVDELVLLKRQNQFEKCRQVSVLKLL